MNLNQFEPNNIYCGDAAVLLAGLPDGCIPLIITSPPYDDMDMMFNPIPKSGMRKYQGYRWDFKAIASHIERVLMPGGVLVWVVADPTRDGRESLASSLQKIYFVSQGLQVYDTMIYEVAGTGAKGSRDAYRQAFEYMFVFSKGTPKTVNLIRDHKNVTAGLVTGCSDKSNGLATRKKTKARRIPQYSVRPNIWRYQASNGTKRTSHPAPFPGQLARDHILTWSNPGDLVLDPMCGSGTTCVQAIENGRQFLGFELSQTYVDEANQRIGGARPPLLVGP